jgi:hypothetical protein
MERLAKVSQFPTFLEVKAQDAKSPDTVHGFVRPDHAADAAGRFVAGYDGSRRQAQCDDDWLGNDRVGLGAPGIHRAGEAVPA